MTDRLDTLRRHVAAALRRDGYPPDLVAAVDSPTRYADLPPGELVAAASAHAIAVGRDPETDHALAALRSFVAAVDALAAARDALTPAWSPDAEPLVPPLGMLDPLTGPGDVGDPPVTEALSRITSALAAVQEVWQADYAACRKAVGTAGDIDSVPLLRLEANVSNALWHLDRAVGAAAATYRPTSPTDGDEHAPF